MLVVDAGLVVAALVDSSPIGMWAEAQIETEPVVAPHILPAEVANVLRRAERTGDISRDAAALAHGDLLDLDIELFPYEPFGARVWALKENLSSYDAWYVALAEMLQCPLATIDLRLARASGPRCVFRTPT